MYDNVEQGLLLGVVFTGDFIFYFVFLPLWFTHFLKWPCVTL